MKKSPYNSKSIKTVFNKRRDELFALMQSKSQFPQLIAKVNEILNSEDLKGNETVADAKIIFDKASSSYNYYLSTLTAYLTGVAATAKNYDF